MGVGCRDECVHGAMNHQGGAPHIANLVPAMRDRSPILGCRARRTEAAGLFTKRSEMRYPTFEDQLPGQLRGHAACPKGGSVGVTRLPTFSEAKSLTRSRMEENAESNMRPPT